MNAMDLIIKLVTAAAFLWLGFIIFNKLKEEIDKWRTKKEKEKKKKEKDG